MSNANLYTPKHPFARQQQRRGSYDTTDSFAKLAQSVRSNNNRSSNQSCSTLKKNMVIQQN